jgi:hypothetical protein
MALALAPADRSRLKQITRGAALCAIATVGIGALAAAVVRIGALSAGLRADLGLQLRGWPRTPLAAGVIAAHNAKLVLGVVVCAAFAPGAHRAARAAVEVVFAATLAGNAALIGAALGAYGARLALLLALHLPLELAATSIAGGVYLTARRAPLSTTALTLAGGVCCLLLAAGGVLETYTPLAGR